MQISAKADYAVRVMLELAAHGPGLVKSAVPIEHQDLPRKFVETILVDLRRADLIRSHRGAGGGHVLARPASTISIGEIVRAIDGPLAEVRGMRPHEAEYVNAAEHLTEVWVAARAALRKILDETSLAQVLSGKLPAHVRRMAGGPEAWAPR
ncbi:RrF2 family transcriptional regulator [Catenulispora yoronensis]|uniref:RrF2 family transcriptional regulator n=1 Tax=Catenulispora yoronensis TaxID=450799 RepID=A0ABN2VAR7_9ACTN